MSDPCASFRPLIDGLADGEIDPSRVEPHLAACAACRRELEAVRALRARLARVRLPDVPRRRRASRAAAAAAAALLAAVLALSLAAPAPLWAASARWHDEVLAGRRILSDLGIPRSATAADYAGGCPCPPELGEASPFVMIRHEGAVVSLLAFEAAEPAPELVLRSGENTVLRETRVGLGLIWVSRLGEAALRRAAERWRPAPGASLRAFACDACCALLESRGRDVDGPFSIELVTGLDRARLRPLSR